MPDYIYFPAVDASNKFPPAINAAIAGSTEITNKVEAAKTFAMAADANNLKTAKAYSDSVGASTRVLCEKYAETEDAHTLTDAKTYADSKDATTLTNAKSYADSKANTTLSSANTYTDNSYKKGTSFPTATSDLVAGRQFYNTSDKILYVYNGSKWTPVVPGEVPYSFAGSPLYGTAWDNSSPIKRHIIHTVVDTPSTGLYNLGIPSGFFKKGVMYGSVSAISSDNRFRINPNGKTTLTQMEIQILNSVGAPYTGLCRINVEIVGW